MTTPAILEEFTIPATSPRYGPIPEWLQSSPALPALANRDLYLHQSKALELVGQKQNLAVSTGTASGKSVIFQLPTLHRLLGNPQRTAIAIYPIKALARDQLNTWRHMFDDCGLDPMAVDQLDGDTPFEERTTKIENTRLALMTPDIIQAWLLKWSDSGRTKTPHINRQKAAIRKFIGNLDILILDEAHSYDGIVGTNSMYLFHRLQYRSQQITPKKPPINIYGASATIANPAEHLHTLTGQKFSEISQADNGAPRAPLTVQHVEARDPHYGGDQDFANTIADVIHDYPEASYIAFIDDRQLVEKTANIIEEAKGWTEEQTITLSQDSMSYRAGLMCRERIEDALKSGRIRGITSTSAMEMGIDIPDLNIGVNLGLPQSVKNTRQRAGRVGRNSPGRFIILAPRDAFQFHGSCRDYWEQPPEPARIYTENPNIRSIHARCLIQENGRKAQPNLEKSSHIQWPSGFQEQVTSLARGERYQPTFQGESKEPHRHSLRAAAEASATITDPHGKTLTDQLTRTVALKEAYPLANYRHAKRSHTVISWDDEIEDGEHVTRICTEYGEDNDTRAVREVAATIRIPHFNPEQPIVHYSNPADATIEDTITGCDIRADHNSEFITTVYEDVGIPNVVTQFTTTATTIHIPETWFEDPQVRYDVGYALISALCNMDGYSPNDLRATPENVTIETDVPIQQTNTVVIWDRIPGGLGISSNITRDLTRYTEKLLRIAQSPTALTDQELPLSEQIASQLHQWAQNVAHTGLPESQQPDLTPLITEYAGTEFRSQLEARWAHYFDKHQLPWEYEPDIGASWLPDFRLHIDGAAYYAEVKPVDFLPIDVANRILDATAEPNLLILGKSPEHKWRYDGADWLPHQFASP